MQPSKIGPPPPRPSTPSSNSITVLLVEDDPTVRELVAYLLKSEGYFVLKARHSAEALYFSGEFTGTVNLLLADLCMAPHMSGRKLAENIRITRPGIPVLYISGSVDDEGVVREIEAGSASFLSKPFGPASLLKHVRQALALPGKASLGIEPISSADRISRSPTFSR